MFQVPYDGPHGPTVEYDDPKIEAYKQAAIIKRSGRNYTMTCHADGQITVAGDGMMPITFARPTPALAP